MKIVADENIPFIREACATLGSVITAPGREISAKLLNDADILFVRSVTSVTEELLHRSKVRFVATATIGVDHIDQDYLASRNIGFASAPGSNADSVTQYLCAALVLLAEREGIFLSEQTLGIIGVGSVGSRVARMAKALGMRVLLCDPPRASKEGTEGFSDLATVLSAANLITTHVPLERQGPYPTFQIADPAFFSAMKPGAYYINTSRGDVCDERALIGALDSGNLAGAVLDVWENEPTPNTDLLRRVMIGTPHIAGYSYDGKVNGTRMITDSARRYFSIKEVWDPAPLLPRSETARLDINAKNREVEEVLREAILTVYSIEADDSRMRGIMDCRREEQAAFFDRLRRDYPLRREFTASSIKLKNGTPEMEEALCGIGFHLVK